jgi:hypothetical protein
MKSGFSNLTLMKNKIIVRVTLLFMLQLGTLAAALPACSRRVCSFSGIFDPGEKNLDNRLCQCW